MSLKKERRNKKWRNRARESGYRFGERREKEIEKEEESEKEWKAES